MISMKFTYRTDPDQDWPGWLPDGAPSTFTPLQAMGAVHDLMEHRRTPNTGSVEEELHALGVMLYIRAEGGYWAGASAPDPADHLAAELARLPEVFAGQISHGARKPVSQYARKCVSSAVMKALKEWNYGAEALKEWNYGAEVESTAEGLKAAESRLYEGYWWAKHKRYKKLPAYMWAQSFEDLQQRVARLRPEEGDRIRLALCLSTGQSRVTELPHLEVE